MDAGTGKPVGPLPVRELFSVGATVRVLVKALSRPGTAMAAQRMETVFEAWERGEVVWPSR